MGRTLNLILSARKSLQLCFLLACVVLGGLVFINPNNVSADAYSDGYLKMSDRLPDDSYTLYKNGTPVSSSSDCLVQWGCTTGNYQFFDPTPNSHQYLTLSNSSINDSSGGAYLDAQTIELEIYTRTLGDKNVSISVVNRVLKDSLACFNTLEFYYYKGSNNQSINALPYVRPTNGCQQNYTAAPFPQAGFQEVLDSKGQGTGTYRGKMVIKFAAYNDPGTQTSFHISSSSDAKFGYYGAGADNVTNNTAKLGASKDSQHGWVNLYPTNLAKYNKLRFYFRPQCNTPAGTSFLLEWDNVNSSNTSVQAIPPSAQLYKYIPGNPAGLTAVRSYNSLGDDFEVRSAQYTENYGPGQPYAYMMEFDSISGGNGISFRYPFDSADARLICPAPDNQIGLGQCTSTYVLGTNGTYTGGYTKNTIVNISGVSPAVSSGFTNASGGFGNGHLGSGASNTWYYSPAPPGFSSPSITLTRYEIYHYTGNTTYDSSGNVIRQHNYWYKVPSSTTSQDIVCTASCSITSVYGDGPGGIILSGGNIYVDARLTNTSPDQYLPPVINGHNLALAINSVAYPTSAAVGSQVGLNPGASVFYSGLKLAAPAPAGAQTYAITAAPVYDGGFFLGGLCGPSVSVYQGFTLIPQSVKPGGPVENPGPSIPYQTIVTLNGATGPVNVNTHSTFYKLGGSTYATFGWAPLGANPAPGTSALNGSIPTPQLIAGDQYCSDINIEHNAGYIGPGGSGDVVWDDDARAAFSDHKCMLIVNRPYFRVLNGDASAGGTVNGCTGGGVLSGFADNTGSTPPPGSGSQFGAFALSVITGYSSANPAFAQTLPLPIGAKNGMALTFANTGVTATNHADSPTMGGNFSTTHCIKPPQQPSTTSNVSSNAADINSLPNGASTHTGDFRLNSGGPNDLKINENKSLFVTGNVYIKNDITYNTNGWNYSSTSTNIPSFTLVATGNIYVDPNVTQLDGIYVANNKIYTCGVDNGTSFSPMLAANLFGNCNKQLLVHGVFMANQLNLMRTYGSMRNFTTYGAGCNQGSFIVSSTNPVYAYICGSEVFEFSPEIYLSNQAIQAPNNGAVQYDAYTSLPPVL